MLGLIDEQMMRDIERPSTLNVAAPRLMHDAPRGTLARAAVALNVASPAASCPA